MRLVRSTWFWLLILTALALAIRLPYWRTMPSDYDEINQMVFSWRIVTGASLPLTGNDAYTGPFFSYVIAALISLGVREPFVGRIIMLACGTLTVPVTALLVLALCKYVGATDGRLAAVVAGVIVVCNLHLVLLNSHIGGATYTLPLFTTAFLWLATSALTTGDVRRWIAAWCCAGLALQANPIAVFLLAGFAGAACLTSNHAPRRLFTWLGLAAFVIALTYSPVIVANLQRTAHSVDVAVARDYLWQPDPTPASYVANSTRLLLQVARQTASAWQATETMTDLTPVTLAFVTFALAGIVFSPRRVAIILMGCVLPYILIVPWFARHYGALDPARFTTFMVPVFAAGMGLLTARITTIPKTTWLRTVPLVVLIVMVAENAVIQLVGFYRATEPTTLNGATINDLSAEMVRLNHGEPVYIGLSDTMLNIRGQPRVPIGFATMSQIGTDFIPIDEVIRRLYEFPGPATMMLANIDAERVNQVAPLARVQTPATARAVDHGYGLFQRDDSKPMVKPDFVRTGSSAAITPSVVLNTRVGTGLELIGYDPPEHPSAGNNLVFTLYWRRSAPMPIAQYMGYVHVVDASTNALVAQKDQRLGADRYPVNAWQTGEVIVETYVFPLPPGSPASNYVVRAGAYTFPDLTRLTVPGNPDNFVALPSLAVAR